MDGDVARPPPGLSLRADARAFHLRALGDTAARDVSPVRRPVGESFFLTPYAVVLQPVGPATSYWRDFARSLCVRYHSSAECSGDCS